MKDPLFGAVGDGVTDDTAAFRAAAHYVASRVSAMPSLVPWPGGGGERVGRAVLVVPPGAYRITQDADAFIHPPSAGANVQGLVIKGAGRYVTQIIYDPPTLTNGDTYLIENVASPGWSNVHFEDIAFHMATPGASFMRSVGPIIQNYTFVRVYWTDVKYGMRLQGTDNNDHYRFWHCGAFGDIGTFFWSETSDQFLSHQFYSFDFEVNKGTFIKATLGGDISVVNSSLISIAPPSIDGGTIFKLEGTTHASGATRFLCEGCRVELRHANSKLVWCEWPNGTVTFRDVDTSPLSWMAHGTTAVTSTFNNMNGQMPLLKWESCKLMGKHEYGYQTMGYAYENHIVYDMCEILNFDEAKDFVQTTFVGGTNNLGSSPLVHFRNCRGSSLDTTKKVIFDTDINWHQQAYARAETKTVGMKHPSGQGPTASQPTVSIRLPANAVITKITLYSPPFGTSTQTNWSYTVRTNEATPTVLHGVGGDGTNQLRAGFNSTATLFWQADTDVKRDITLVANANVDQGGSGFQCIIEYIG